MKLVLGAAVSIVQVTLAGLASGMLAAVAYVNVKNLGRLGESEWRVVFYFTLSSTLISFVTIPFGWVLPASRDIALLVLAGFTVLILRRLAEGQRPPCAGFGGWSTKPLGRGHVVRNLCFIGLAVVAMLA